MVQLSKAGPTSKEVVPMNRKNILVISNMYPSAKHKSYGIFVQSQVNALRKRGVHVDTITIKDPRTNKVAITTKYFIWALRAFANFLTRGRRYHVVHAHYVFPSGLLALFYKKMWRTRMVVTSHGGDLDKMAMKNDLIFAWTKKVLGESDEVIAVGEELKARLITEFHVPKEKITLLNMGVDRSVFKPLNKSIARKKLQLKKHAKILLFTGNIIEQKGVMDLVTAIHLIIHLIDDEKIFLYLVGPQKDTHFLKTLKSKIQKYGLQNQVFLPGIKTQAEIRVWMCAADVFVLPSHMEGFGLVALEAMACGLPVVGTNVGGLRYLLADEAGEVIEKKDPKSLAASIMKVLNDPILMEKYIHNGFKKAKENDQQWIIDQMMVLYFKRESERNEGTRKASQSPAES